MAVWDPVHRFFHTAHLEWIGVEVGLGVEIGARYGVCGVSAVEGYAAGWGGMLKARYQLRA